MQKTRKLSVMSCILCIVLIAAMALCTIGCTDNKTPDTSTAMSTLTGGDYGEGATAFTFTVTDNEGKETVFQIHTDKTTVGEALQELNLIAGEEGAYGLYVKTVNGMTFDYDKDGKFWAFYENGTMAAKGVDQTEIIPDAFYAFKVE